MHDLVLCIHEVNKCIAECEVLMKLCHLQFHYFKRHTTSSSPTTLTTLFLYTPCFVKLAKCITIVTT